MRKEISIIISAIFIITLMTSLPVSSVRVAGTTIQSGQDFRYSVSISPPVARVQQNDLATFDIKVSRGPDLGPFSVHLSLVSDSSILKATGSFDPPVLNFKQGQTSVNSTLRINSQELEAGTTAFRVQAGTQPPGISDRTFSNPATIIVGAVGPESQSLTTSKSLPTEKTPASVPSKLNNPPIAKAGQDQIIKEGEKGVLDGSASTDRDKDALSFSWEQISPKQPIIRLSPSDASNNVAFVAPDVNRDTIFRFNLVVKDADGGQAVDSINILTTNVQESEPPNALPKQEDRTQKEQNQEKPTSQESTLSNETTASPTSNQVPTGIENHSPTAETQQVLLTGEGKALSVTLNGKDSDKDDKISYVILSNPTHGTIAGFDKTTGSLTYLPTSGFVGQDRLTYKVIDSQNAESNAGVVVIRVSAASQSPMSPAPTDSTLDNSSFTSTTSPSEPSSSLAPEDNENENATSASLMSGSIETLAADETPPEIVSTEPEDGATNVPVSSVINATFSEPMNASTVNEETFQLFEIVSETRVLVDGTVELIDGGFNATFTPTASLTSDNPFEAQIRGDSCPCVEDLAGNSIGSDISWSFTTAATGDAEISMTLDPPSQKWGHEITAQGTATGAGEDDKISIDWNDGTAFTEISPVPEGGEYTATHVYNISAASDPEKLVVAKLLSSGGEEGEVERARAEVSTTIQKHVTSLSLDMKPSPDSPVCSNCHFTVFGKLIDLDAVPEPEPDIGVDIAAASDPEIGGKTITFSGSGASTLDPVPTEGLTFTGDSNNDLTLTSSSIKMHVFSKLIFHTATSGITLDFSGASGSSVVVALTKAVAPFDTVTVTIPVGSPQNVDLPIGIKDMTITSIDGSSDPSEFAELAMVITRDSQLDPGELLQVDLSNVSPDPGQYPVLVINPGWFTSDGVTQVADEDGLKIKGQFDGTNDPAYLGATSSPEISYNIDSSAAGTGTGEFTDDPLNPNVWTKLTVGTATTADVCTFNGAPGLDADKDGICDRWESPTTPSPGPGLPANSLDHRYVTCPTMGAAGTPHSSAIDPKCPLPVAGQAPPTMYDLCFDDKFDNLASEPICPKPGHKDLYLEIDYKSTHAPNDIAIKNLIKAFANAPSQGNSVADEYGNLQGITLHVVKDGSISTIPNNVFAWRDPAALNFNDNNFANDFFSIKRTNFGTAAERAGTSTMPGLNTAAKWATPPSTATPAGVQGPGSTLKHYVYHYALWVNFYSKTPPNTRACPTGGLSTGLGEITGNDFIVSLGCGWGTYDTSARSIAQQTGTALHEFGHNLGLNHGAHDKAPSVDKYMNCKPNHLSVMNYARQMPYDLAGTVGAVDATDIANWEAGYFYGAGTAAYHTMADFSGIGLPAVQPASQTEDSLDQVAGVVPSDGKKYRVVYLKTNAGTVAMRDSGSGFDFDGDGKAVNIATLGTKGDINNIGSKIAGCGPKTAEIEKSFNDWAAINLVFLPDSDSADGVVSAEPIEVTPAFANEIKAKAHGLGVQFIPPPNTDGSSIFNTGSIVPLKFRLTDKDGNFIRNAAVTFVAEKASTPCTTCTGTFVYNRAQEQYQFDWKTPKTAQAKGQWTISYFINYQTPNQVLLQGPQAQASGGLFTLKVTGR